jgi:MSHA biogenesis protein MshQ
MMKRLLFWFCFLLVAPLQSAFSAIAIDNTSSNFFNNSSSLTVSHTTSNGADRFMLVGVSLWNEDNETVSSVTYGGTGLTRIGSVSNGNDSRVEIWKLLNPAAGTANVAITFSSRVQKGAGAGVMTFTGVDQISPHDTFQSRTGDSDEASISVSSASGDLVFVAAASEEQDDPLDIDAGTERWNVKVNGNKKFAGAGGTRNGSNSTTIRWDLGDSDDWAIAGLSINPSLASTPLPSPRLAYRFDDCTLAAGVTDSAGIYDGTANNTESTDTESRINRSLNLSATGALDWVTVPQSSVNSLNDFSISVWIKTAVSKSQQEIFHALGSSDGDDEIEVYLINGTQVQMNVGGSGASVSAGKTLTDDNWHHLLVTRDANQMCLYVDGAFAACHTSGGAGQISINNASAVVLGQEQDSFGGSFSSSQAYDGYMDEFKIYDEELTSSHANQIYTNEGGGLNADGTTRAPITCSTPLPTPLAEYRMDESSWSGVSGEVKDSVNNYDGVAISTQTVAGKICRAADLSAPGIGDYLSLNGNVFANQGDFTISSWVKTPKTSNQSLVSGANSSSMNELIFWMTSGSNFQPHLNNANLGNITINNTLTNYADDLWHHLVWVRSGTQNCLYVDKALQGCRTANSTNINIASNGLIVGQEQDSLGGGFVASQAWEGLVDELIFFDEALSATDIGTVFDLQDASKNLDGTDRVCVVTAITPVADWRFDESTWSNNTNEILDASGNDYHGTAFNSSPSSDAQLCNSADLSLAGTTDYLSMNKDAMDGLTDFTIIVWAKTTGTQDSTIISAASGNTGAATNEVVFYFDNNTRFWPTITASPFNTNTQLGSTTSAMRDGDWHQLAWTRTASSRQSCFLFDGVSQGCTTHPDGDDSDPVSVALNGLIIGQDQDVVSGGFDSSQDWEGKLDEFLIFDQVLTQTQISTIRSNIMNSNNWDGTPRSCGAVVDHYSINHDGAGVTCLLESITISAHDSGHTAVDAQGNTVNLSTTSGKGDWIGIVSGGTGLNNGAAGDGAASFTFNAGATNAVLTFAHPLLSGDTETFAFNVTDGSITEESGSATTVLDDPSILYSLAGFRFIDSLGATLIPTQISGKASNVVPNADALYLQAVRASDNDPNVCVAALSGLKTIKLAAQCDNPTSCVTGQTFNVKSGANAAVNIALNNASPVIPTAYSDVDMLFDGEAKAPLVLNYSDAGQMQLHASFTVPATSAVLTGPSNQFVVRPFVLGFPSVVAGAVANPEGDEAGPDASTGFVSAGSDFNVNVNAYRYQAADDDDGTPDGVPDAGVDVTNNGITPNFTGTVTLSVDSYTPASGVLGSLSGNTALLLNTYVIRSGADAIATLQYDEVGSVSLVAEHANYLGVSDADINSQSIKVGRFYPDHFAMSGDSVTAACTPLSGFTYIQQPFAQVQYTLEARPKGVTDATGSNGRITQNYDQDDYVSTALLDPSAEDGNTGVDLSARITAYSAANGWQQGVYSVDRVNETTFRRNPSEVGLEDGPYTSLQMGVSVSSELDGRDFDSAELTMKANDSNDCVADGDCDAAGIGALQELRYGRMRIQSAHGPETEDLSVPFVTEYWNGTAFVTNVDDSCTEHPLSSIRFDGNAIGPAVADRTVTVGDGATIGSISVTATNATTAVGDYSLVFSAPGAAASGSDNTGYFPVSVINVEAWLRYDWDQDGAANDNGLPDALVTFGRARGNDRMIFWQERYQ